MKSNKLLVFISCLLTLSLASCGGGQNHNPGADESESSETTQSTSDTGSSEESQGSESSIVLDQLDGLTVFTYGRYMDEANITSIKNAFDAYSATQGYEVINQVWAGDSSSAVADFATAVGNYETNTGKIDIILGAKGNLDTTYVGENFDVLKDGDGNYVTMSTYVGESEKTERRIWISKTVAHLDAVKLLVKSAANYDIPEEEPEDPTSESSESTPSESSEESQSSSETSSESTPSSEESSESSESSEESSESQASSEESSESQESSESSEAEPVVLPELVVYCYQNAVTQDQMNALKSTFDTFVDGKHYVITVNTWVLATTGNMAALQDDVEAYDTDHAGHGVDVILGARASFSQDYASAHFVYAGNDDADGRMTIGSSSNRRVAFKKDSTNKEAITLLINCFLPNLDFTFPTE